MGNCYFKTEYENDNIAGKLSSPFFSLFLRNTSCNFHFDVLILISFSCYQKFVQISLRDWKRRLWKSMESGEKEGSQVLRHERDA